LSKKANPTLVGVFVLIALALALVAIVILGKIKLKDNRFRCVAYFTGSLFGLDIGAPVTFRGVTIGRVSEHADVVRQPFVNESPGRGAGAVVGRPWGDVEKFATVEALAIRERSEGPVGGHS